MLKKLLYTALLLCINLNYINAASITGNADTGDVWDNLIYLSVINSFDDLNTASYDFLIARTEIDSLGNFEFNGLELPKDDRLYRLHICKKGDPVSTIIIGGKDENFIHFIMKGSDSIHVSKNSGIKGFQYSIVQGNPANKNLSKLFEWRKNLNSPPPLPSEQSRQLLRENVQNNYYHMADTSSYVIIQLLSMYLINESFATSGRLELMNKIRSSSETSDTSSPYFKAFKEELSFLQFQAKKQSRTKTIWVFVIAAILVAVSILTPGIINKRKIPGSRESGFSEFINQLSLQEKKVFDLLKEGKSNKEISQELHIEVSTVKSHLNKIYSRLGVSGRKDIVNSEW